VSETSKVLAIALTGYALFLPAAFIVGRSYTAIERPEGSKVETIGQIFFDHPDHYYAKLHVFNQAHFPDTSGLSVYENLVQLSDFSFTSDSGRYVVRFKTTDGSDARTNGRKYWVVAP
jgi:hypothetical protein